MSLPDLKYACTLPRIAGLPEEELENCLEQISVTGWIPLKITVFLNASSEEKFEFYKNQLAEIIATKYKRKCPAFSIVSQSPKAPFNVGMEAALLRSEETMFFRQFEDIPYVVIEKEGNKFLWALGLSVHERLSVNDGAKLAFEKMHAILNVESLSFDDVVRQWNYLPQICHIEKNNGFLLQHYQMFNEVRHYYYQKYRSKKCFPAATGIGVKYGNFTLDFFACTGGQELQDLKLESPLQKNPYQYGQNVLVGTSLITEGKKHAPEFERARILISSDGHRVFVSGTASIEGEATTDVNNLLEQTNSTIHNIASLISRDNLMAQYPGISFSDLEYDCLRVYVKERNDIPMVEEIVRKKFENTPIMVIQAEICRCDLLVEIEAEMKG